MDPALGLSHWGVPSDALALKRVAGTWQHCADGAPAKACLAVLGGSTLLLLHGGNQILHIDEPAEYVVSLARKTCCQR